MNFILLRETLRQARHQAPTERQGVRRIGMTLDEAAIASGINRSTIHAIENVKREPKLKPELETIERLVFAYGQRLSEFFLQLEDGLPVAATGGDSTAPSDQSQVADDDALPRFRTEEQIQASVLRYLSRLALKGLEADEGKRPSNYRLPPDSRPHAAERNQTARTRRRRHVSTPKKNRS